MLWKERFYTISDKVYSEKFKLLKERFFNISDKEHSEKFKEFDDDIVRS